MRNAILFLAGQSLPRPASLPLRIFQRLSLWRRHAAQLSALRELDDRLLEDIGVTRGEVDRLSDTTRWDAPSHWTWNG